MTKPKSHQLLLNLKADDQISPALERIQEQAGKVRSDMRGIRGPRSGRSPLAQAVSPVLRPMLSPKLFGVAVLASAGAIGLNLAEDFESRMIKVQALANASSSQFRIMQEKVEEAILKYRKEKKDRLKVSLKKTKKSESELATEKKKIKEVEDKLKAIEEEKKTNGELSNATIAQNDATLREALLMTTDYIRLLKNQKLVSMNIVDLEKPRLNKASAGALPSSHHSER